MTHVLIVEDSPTQAAALRALLEDCDGDCTEAMKAARVAVGQSASMVNIALGAVDKALVELKATGRMTEAQKGALSRETADKVEQVEELNARSRKYNLPTASAPERQP